MTQITPRPKFIPISNGEAYSNTGQRRVVFTSDLKLRPVLYAVYSGYQPSRGTVQGSLPGDIIASVVWGRNREDYALHTYSEEGEDLDLPVGQQAQIWMDLKKLHPWLDSWLAPTGRQGTFLPKEVVPESEYLSVKAKDERIGRFLRRFGLPYKAESFAYDRKADLHVRPRPLDFNPDEHLPWEKRWTGSVVDIHRTERWFSSNGDGSQAVELKTDPQFESGSNYAHEETIREDGTTGIPGWQDRKFLVKIVHGANTKDHCSWGHTVDVWTVR